jgi:hypothetical protein
MTRAERASMFVVGPRCYLSLPLVSRRFPTSPPYFFARFGGDIERGEICVPTGVPFGGDIRPEEGKGIFLCHLLASAERAAYLPELASEDRISPDMRRNFGALPKDFGL